ncbi:MAG TPA: MFS transporter [Armatimonadota bacterium]|jgi:fucose permease
MSGRSNSAVDRNLPGGPPTRAEQRRLLAAAYAGMLGLAACTSPLAVCLTAFARSFPELTTARLGMVSTVSLTGVVAGILFSGPLADRWGLRPFMILGAALQIVGLLAVAAAPTSLLLLGAICLVGCGTGLVDGLASPLVAALQSENRTRALNWLHACYPLGFLAMAGISATILRQTDSWRLVFPALALPALLSLALCVATRFPAQPRQESLGAALRLVAGNRAVLMALGAILLAGATEMGVEHWTPTFVERALGRSRELGALVLSGFALGMMVGRFATGALAKWLPPARLVLLACGVSLVALLGIALGPAPLALAAILLLGLGVSAMWPTLMAYAADREPAGGATMFSLLGALGNVGAGFAPLYVGLIAQQSGLRVGLGAAAIFPVLAGLLLLRPGLRQESANVGRPAGH